MSDTPRTDQAAFPILARLQSGTEDVVEAAICRDLERDLAAVTAALLDMTADRDSWRQQCSDRADDAAKAIRERDALLKECRAAAQALAWASERLPALNADYERLSAAIGEASRAPIYAAMARAAAPPP